ncbi:MAG: GTPase ObgE [Firmicutes bacterium]|nr:GTPase ObgE [Bacillota bacterium]
MFFDEAIVEVIAGAGGNGCMAMRREKYVEMGGPFGGNGGNGADIIFQADEGLNTLIDLRYQKLIKGPRGENGLGKGMHGKSREAVIVKVPVGTVVTDFETGELLADLTENKEEAVIAKGGHGGRGNMALATRTNPAPSFCENGEPGEEKKLKVELKLLADVGLVGLPSVGKSTIISMISAAKPKIAEYHFTTLKPNLGVVRASNHRSFVVADLPGLIKGASLGEGLGDRFLKHIERTRVIAHVVDMGGFEERDPYEDYVTINEELKSFKENLMKKPQIVIANKMDLPNAKERLEAFQKKVDVPIYEVSAALNQGLDKVIDVLADMLDHIKKEPLYVETKTKKHVVYKFERQEPFAITKEDNTWVVRGKEIEHFVRIANFSSEEAYIRLSKKMRSMGIEEELRNRGAKTGDYIRILDWEFEYDE